MDETTLLSFGFEMELGKSKLQKCVSLFLMEDKYIVMIKVGKKVSWTKQLLLNFGFEMELGKSKLQNCVSLFLMEDKYIVMTKVGKKVSWTKQLC